MRVCFSRSRRSNSKLLSAFSLASTAAQSIILGANLIQFTTQIRHVAQVLAVLSPQILERAGEEGTNSFFRVQWSADVRHHIPRGKS